MTEMVVGVTLTADGSGLVGQLKISQAALAGLAGSAKETSSAFAAGRAAGQDYAQMAAQLRAQLDPMFAVQQRFDQELARAEQLYGLGAISAREFGAAQQMANDNLRQGHAAIFASNTAIKDHVVNLRQQRAGMQQLSMQIGDVATQFALGANPMMIFAAQGQQVVQALALMKGGGTGLIAFLGGPWGAAILGAVTVVGMLVSKLTEAKEASAGLEFSSYAVKDAQGILGSAIDLTTGKINTQSAAVMGLARAQLALARIKSQTRCPKRAA